MNTKTEEYYLNLIKSSSKLKAIKAYYDEHQCSLADAKNFIDELEKRNSTFLPEKNSDEDLIYLLQKGQKFNAIKAYRNKTNCSLKEAKNYVENLEYLPGMGSFDAKSFEHSPNITSLKTKKTKLEGCFIATVCYDGYNTPEVIRFRYFRDDILLKTFFGKVFVKVYYLFSPRLSKVISKSDKLKRVVKKCILDRVLKRIE